MLKKLHTDSLLIIDNFNVLPKDDSFLKELTTLFLKHCPSSRNNKEVVSSIIDEVNGHTLTVCIAALTLEASGIEPQLRCASLFSPHCLLHRCYLLMGFAPETP